MIALPSLDEPMFHNSGDEKSSLKEIGPRPGFRSGVGRGVASVTGEGVAEGGNHTMVGEGALAAGSAAPVAVESAGVWGGGRGGEPPIRHLAAGLECQRGVWGW